MNTNLNSNTNHGIFFGGAYTYFFDENRKRINTPSITGTSLSGSTLTVFFDHAPAVKDLEIVAYGCSYYTETNGPAGGVDGFEVSSKTCVIDIPTNYPTVYVKVHAKYGNYVNCGQANETCVQIDNAQWGPYTDCIQTLQQQRQRQGSEFLRIINNS